MAFYCENKERLETIHPMDESFEMIHNPNELYELLIDLWSKETCAFRMQKDWEKDNPSLGQCSITAFLTQDIFGGEVYGIKQNDGSYHCYNVVDGIVFDLTSEQFSRPLVYDLQNPQSREIHFESDEKYMRYRYLKKRLEEVCQKRKKKNVQ